MATISVAKRANRLRSVWTLSKETRPRFSYSDPHAQSIDFSIATFASGLKLELRLTDRGRYLGEIIVGHALVSARRARKDQFLWHYRASAGAPQEE